MNEPVCIDGRSLTARQVVEIACRNAEVYIAEEAIVRMNAARAVVDRAVKRGEMIYGVTTSVGAKLTVPLNPEQIGPFNKGLLLTHNFGHGPTASKEVVRAMMVILLNAMASGFLGVRPLLAEMLVNALNAGRSFEVHVWGSTGESDMSPVADLAIALYADIDLTYGEGLALINSSPLSIGTAALACDELSRLLDSWLIVAALSMEGFAANPSILSPAAIRSRPFPGLGAAAEILRRQLEGSCLFERGGPRNLQDPYTFRSLPITFGNALDSFSFAARQISIELNSSQNNPIVSIEDEALISVANFDLVSLSMALDTMRLALAPVVTSSTERVAKMAGSIWSGLPTGLIAADSVGLPGFNGLAQVHLSLASEARLLAGPVITELASSSHSNGIGDRVSLASTAARRTRDMGQLCKSLLAMELIVAAQAIDMRQRGPLGMLTGKLFEFVRSVVPRAGEGQRVPHPAPLMGALDSRGYQLDFLRA
jgi:histidine ammonia-lyase